jgi:hypothetical protein
MTWPVNWSVLVDLILMIVGSTGRSVGLPTVGLVGNDRVGARPNNIDHCVGWSSRYRPGLVVPAKFI